MRTGKLAFPKPLRVQPSGAYKRSSHRPDPFLAGANLLHARVAPSEATRVHRPRIEARVFEVDGLEVLIPGAFTTWISNLRRSCTFPDLRAELASVAKLDARSTKTDGRPTVGVLAPEPDALLSQSKHGAEVRRVFAKLQALGLRPVLIPARADLAVPRGHRWRSAEVADKLLGSANLCGILGLGGADVHPRLYGQKNRYARQTNYPRDRFEADVALAGLARELPMFGICRSHQLWNAATGGRLVQDIEQSGLSSLPRDQRDFGIPLSDAFSLGPDVAVEPSSRMFQQVGTGLRVNAAHHQAVDIPGAPFVVTATVTDPVIGARMIQATEGPSVTTVQFHPEARIGSPTDDALLEAFARQVLAFKAA